MKPLTVQTGEALLLSLAVAIQQERAAENALDQADADRVARQTDLHSAKRFVAEAGEAIRQLAASMQITTAEASPDREASNGQTLKSGVMPALTQPAIGEYWVGQGGIYGGIRQYPEGLCHVIFAAEDVGEYAWGARGVETGATSRLDGRANANTSDGGEYPAFQAASKYTADGHKDFELPSIAELNHAWATIPDSFANAAYWSSSQRSANGAFHMHFGAGYQDTSGKGNELRVRPVRRFFI